jgi:hypothetical protein
MTIKRSNLVLQPEILMDAVQGEFQKVIALLGTGAAAVNSSLPGGVKGTEKIKIPYFGTIPEFVDITNEGDALTPASFSMTDDDAEVKHAGQAIEITQWAQIAAMYADPYAELARQLREAAQRRYDKALIDAAITTTLEKSVYVDTNVAANKKLLDYDVMIDAKTKFGDEQENLALLIVHSNVYADLQKLRDGNDIPLLTQPTDGSVPRFAGVPVKVSDRMPITAGTPATGSNKYTSLLVKKNALALWYNGAPEVQEDRDILKDAKLAALHIYFIAHLYSRLPGTTKTGAVKIQTNASAD